MRTNTSNKILKRKLEKGSKEQNDIITKRWKSIYGKIFDVTKESEQINFCQTFTAMVTEKFENHQTSQQNEPIHSCEQIKRGPNSLYQSICSLITKLGNDYPARHILDLFQDGITANFFQSLAILYFLKKASKELEVFYKKGMIKEVEFSSPSITTMDATLGDSIHVRNKSSFGKIAKPVLELDHTERASSVF